MKTKLSLAILLILLCLNVTAQKEYYNWYFGDSAGITFLTGPPSALMDGKTATGEGCATISDSAGNLLFYTDGNTVWDQTHAVMKHGSNLVGILWAKGVWSSTQAALILPHILEQKKYYYIFTVTQAEDKPIFFYYAMVDMTLNGGLGEVTKKTIFIDSLHSEKQAAVMHSNGHDIWIMVEKSNRKLAAYLLTDGGLSSTTVISNIDSVIAWDCCGQMKFSPSGKKIALAIWNADLVCLFDFDNSTGYVSNEKKLPAYGSYGIEFSNSEQYLYSSSGTGNTDIYQWDITSPKESTVIATRKKITPYPEPNGPSQLQMGPDRKIYVTKWTEKYLGVIDKPDLSGMSANYIDSAIYLGGRTSWYGLPNIMAGVYLLTSTDEHIRSETYSVYPNPFSDRLNIITKENLPSEIILYDLTSRKLIQQKFTNSISLNTSQLAGGLYFYEVRNENGTVAKGKVVKE